MDPFITLSILIIVLVVIGGVWGSLVISSLLKRRHLRLQASAADPPSESLLEEYRRLEMRLERLEDEVGFLRELGAAQPPEKLRAPAPDEPGG